MSLTNAVCSQPSCVTGSENCTATGLLIYYAAAWCCSSILDLKTQHHSEPPHIDHCVATSADTSVCGDVKEVDRSVLKLYSDLESLGPFVKFWRSDTISKKINRFTDLRVAGLDGQTVGDVLEVFRSSGCFPFLLGGSVRDQLLSLAPNDVDVSVDCTPNQLKEICAENWGRKNCHSLKNSDVVHLGDWKMSGKTLDIGTAAIFYTPLYKLEYTVNALLYDVNVNDVIIDLTGTGVSDACQWLIKIPSPDDSVAGWNHWLHNTEGVLYRYWKLRVKGLQPFSEEMQEFVVECAKKKMQSLPESFPMFYCNYVFHSSYNYSARKCTIKAEKCAFGLVNAAQYNSVFSEDFGVFWTNVIVPRYLPSLEDCSSLHKLKLTA